MILNDAKIAALGESMIYPFFATSIRSIDRDSGMDGAIAPLKAISYGLGGSGYDIRLSPREFKIFKPSPGEPINPKNFSGESLNPVELQSDKWGDYFVIPGNSYGLGVAMERLTIPTNITVLCLGKSTYARAGLIANITPAEPGWSGHLTLEFSNSSPAPVRIYANEGVVQLLFFDNGGVEVPYGDRSGGGKYEGQPEAIVLAKV